MPKLFNTVAIAVLVLALFACKKEESKKQFTALSDFEGAKIASQSGAIFDRFINAVIPNVEHHYFNTTTGLVAALSSGKVDAISLDMPVAKYLIASNLDLTIFPEIVTGDRYGFAVAKNSELGVKGNEALQKLKDNGTINQVESIWFSADESKKSLPTFDYEENAQTIKYGCDVSLIPMSYADAKRKPTGFDLDVMTRIAKDMNMKIEVVPMQFDALLPSLASGNVDIVGGSMSITEERLKSVDFIGTYYEGGIVLVVKKERLGN